MLGERVVVLVLVRLRVFYVFDKFVRAQALRLEERGEVSQCEVQRREVWGWRLGLSVSSGFFNWV